MKLLVADSDVDLVEMLTSWLRTRGYQVKYAFNAERFRSQWIEQHPDLVIVDTSLKGVDALGLCRDLQSVHDALVLATAREQGLDMQARCLESGADIYLAKPFLPSHLLAHIHALARRVRRTLMRDPASILTVGPIHVDLLRHEVSVYGETSRLTPTESKILHLLAVNVNDVCSLEQIVAHVWGYGEAFDTTLVKPHIRHLREKIERDPSKPGHLVTVAGSGYMLALPPEQNPLTDTSTEMDQMDDDAHAPAMNLETRETQDELRQREMIGEGENAQLRQRRRQPFIVTRQATGAHGPGKTAIEPPSAVGTA